MSAKVDLKVVLLGKEGSGKTCLVERYLHDRFSDGVNQATVGAAFGAKRLQVRDIAITMGIWDTAGSERYEAMSRIYYRGAKAAIVCFDVLDAASFERLKFWVSELRENEEQCKLYVCGTKSDMAEGANKARRVDVHTVQDYVDELSAKYFETSSKTGAGINELFTIIADDFVRTEVKSHKAGAASASNGTTVLTSASSGSSSPASGPPCCV